MFLLFIVSFSLVFSSNQIFVACEGNFYQENGSLWTIIDDEVYEYSENPVGEILQSVLVHGNILFAIVNVSNNIKVFNIFDEGLELLHTIDTQYSGPREMIAIDDYLYFSNWYTSDIKRLNLNTWIIDQEIDMPGLPEDIVELNNKLYISIIMEDDWTDGSEVVVVDTESATIVEVYDVGPGPGELVVHENEVIIARTYYDDEWNAFYGTSKINESNEVIIANYGAGTACGGSVHSYNGAVYRGYEGGIAKLDPELNILYSSKIGDFNPQDVYSVESIGDFIYFGLTDFSAPDQVVVLNSEGALENEFLVGALPGDFVEWMPCVADGDVNSDSVLNIVDIIEIVQGILNQNEYDCTADMNGDSMIDIIDVVSIVQLVLE